MLATVLDGIAVLLGIGVAVVIAVTVALVVRGRPRQYARVGRDPYRVRGRSIRGWQASAIREIRRAGRAGGRRGR